MQNFGIDGNISLKAVPRNQQTERYFNAAARNGERDVLSSLDALSSVMYVDAYERCGAPTDSSFPAERCRQVVERSDMRKGSFTEAEIMQKLSEVPDDRQRELIHRAGAFMKDAASLVRTMKQDR